MALTIFTAICLLGCGFMLYVLLQWIKDRPPRTATKEKYDEMRIRKRPHIVSSRKKMTDFPSLVIRSGATERRKKHGRT
jgi:hypothetical protein